MNDNLRFDIIVPLLTAVFIFLITALVGVWAAPDQRVALLRFGLIGVGLGLTLGIAWIGSRHPVTTTGIIGLICSALAAILTLHFLVTVNWVETGSNLPPLLRQFGHLIHTLTPVLSEWPNLHKNLTGGVLIMLLPLGVGGTVWARSRQLRAVVFASVAALLLAVVGLLMTGSRGAWMGLSMALLYTGHIYWRFGRPHATSWRWLADVVILASVGLIIGGFWLVMISPEFREALTPLLSDSSMGRVQLWQESLSLVQDYSFTGSGMGNTAMIYASYLFLLHVPYLFHAHNLYLQIALEQGLPGLIAFLAMFIYAIAGLITVYRDSSNPLLGTHCLAVLAASIAMLGHGLVEAGLYAHHLLPIVFFPLGLTLALLLGSTPQAVESGNETIIRRRQQIGFLASMVPIVLIVALFLWPGAMARLEANLGAVAQSRAELSVYHWPEWPLQDEVRRNQVVDLSPAQRHYTTALTLDAGNVTAHRRLGQIALSLGEYDLAREHLAAAYHLAPNQRATRQMLGELYAIRGDQEQALHLWQTIDVGQGQLDIRYWWHNHIGATQQAEQVQQVITRLHPAAQK